MGTLGYVTLNILRVASIITLLLSAITSWAILVLSIKANSFFFFDGVSHVVVSLICIFLIFSESALFDRYFAKHWPILGPESGLVFLGVSMILLGSNILGNLNLEIVKEQEHDEDEDHLGSLSLLRLILASGILIALFGFFNIIATYVFCDSAQGITGRQMRSYNTSIRAKETESPRAFSFSKNSKGGSLIESSQYQLSPTERRKSRFRLPLGIGSNSSRSHSQSQSKWQNSISLPIQHEENDLEKVEKRSDRSSPIFPELERPPTALHPAYNQNNSTPYPASSRYSVMSDMTRF